MSPYADHLLRVGAQFLPSGRTAWSRSNALTSNRFSTRSHAAVIVLSDRRCGTMQSFSTRFVRRTNSHVGAVTSSHLLVTDCSRVTTVRCSATPSVRTPGSDICIRRFNLSCKPAVKGPHGLRASRASLSSTKEKRQPNRRLPSSGSGRATWPPFIDWMLSFSTDRIRILVTPVDGEMPASSWRNVRPPPARAFVHPCTRVPQRRTDTIWL